MDPIVVFDSVLLVSIFSVEISDIRCYFSAKYCTDKVNVYFYPAIMLHTVLVNFIPAIKVHALFIPRFYDFIRQLLFMIILMVYSSRYNTRRHSPQTNIVST